MNILHYIPPTRKPYDDWTGFKKQDYQPTDRQSAVIDATRSVLDNMKKRDQYTYTDVVCEAVGLLLGVDSSNPLRIASKEYNVCNGIFGSDVYYATDYIRAQEQYTENIATIKAFNLVVGLKIGALMDNGKKLSRCIIETLSDGHIEFSATRGNRRYKYNTCKISSIKRMADDAHNSIFNNTLGGVL